MCGFRFCSAYQRLQNALHFGHARDPFGARDAEIDPAGIETVQHLGARRGAILRHAVGDESLDPSLPRHGKNFDLVAEHRSEGLRDIERRVFSWTRNLDIPRSGPRLLHYAGAGTPDVLRGDHWNPAIERLEESEQPPLA